MRPRSGDTAYSEGAPLDEPSELFNRALRQAEAKASERLGSPCRIFVHYSIDDELLSKLEAIDHEKFRQELWYTHDEFLEKTKKRDFVCMVLSVGGEPTAFLYGYDYEADPEGFFLDELVTRVEGKGLGKVLLGLLIHYCIGLSYRSITLYTEETDEKGRRLKEFYERLGFGEAALDPSLGLIMRYVIAAPTL
ncbi:GNAT family N-acetyltransferase [Candidatus Bathyarchaeota archaeon]|nr:GNAT family N-acetyltransferase [Candidatus Bathyarchaeota archaeon]